MMNAIVLLALVFAVVGAVWGAVLAGQWVYTTIRHRFDRPLTDEEKWQETSAESMSEEEWAALMASAEFGSLPVESGDDDDVPSI